MVLNGADMVPSFLFFQMCSFELISIGAPQINSMMDLAEFQCLCDLRNSNEKHRSDGETPMRSQELMENTAQRARVGRVTDVGLVCWCLENGLGWGMYLLFSVVLFV